MYDTVFFDLDGTLTDPFNGITRSVQYALSKFGIDAEDRSALRCFIGPPLLYSFKTYFNFSDADAQRAVEYYREYFVPKGIYDNTLYSKTVPVLKALKAHSKKTVLATSKPEEFAIKILEHFDIYGYFDIVCGASMDASRNTKEAVLATAIERSNLTDISTAVMVGDRHHDIDAARCFSMDSIGVEYGFAEPGELKKAGASYIVSELDDILDIVL